MFDGIYLQPPSDDEMAAVEDTLETSLTKSSECVRGEPIWRHRTDNKYYFACAKCQCLINDSAQYIKHAKTCYGNVRAAFANELGDPRVIEFDAFPAIGNCYVCKNFKQFKNGALVMHEFVCAKRDWYGERNYSTYIPPMSEWTRVAGKLVPPAEFVEVMKYFDAVGNWPAHEREYLNEYDKCFFTPCADKYIIKTSAMCAETLSQNAAHKDEQITKSHIQKDELFVPIETSEMNS